MKKIRWGVLGSANIAVEQVLPAMRRSSNAIIAAIATRNKMERANEIAEEFAIENVYQGYEALLEATDIDAIYIPLPNHVHKEWAIKAAEHGKHVLCEKPAALTEADVHEIKATCTQHDVLFMEAFMYAFHPQHERVKQLIRTEEIGQVKYITAGFSFDLPVEERTANIRMNEEAGGGSMYDIGCYAVHAMRNILGAEPESIQLKGKIDPDYTVDTDTVGYVSFPDGVQATFDVSFNLPMRHEYHVFGTEGTIRVPRAFRPDLHGGEGIVIVEKADNVVTETISGDQYCLQIEHFSDAILNKNTVLKNSMESTIHNARVIDAAYQSLASGEEVNIASS